MISKGDIVSVKENPDRVVSPDMNAWIAKHKYETFYVENVNEKSAKLKRVEFWITLDLLEKKDGSSRS